MSGFEKNGSSDVAYQLEGLDPREKAERIAASFVPPTPEEERKVIQKLDRRLLPLVFVLYSLAVLDRSNLGNARLAGLTKSIDLSGNRYGLEAVPGSHVGLPTCILAVVVFFLLPDGITSARFLTERDKQIALHFVARNQRLDVGKQQGLRFREMLEGFKDPKSWIPGFCYFGCNVSYASLPLFVPTIISEMGKWSPAQSNGLSAPPYLLCFFYIITVCWLSDRFKMRGPFCALSATIGAIGFIILATATKTGARYFALFMAVQIFASVALLLAWTANIHATESKRAGGYVVLATIGQCGPLLGTNVFPDSEKPYFRKGMWISAAFCLLVAVLSLMLSTWLIFENRKMAREGVPEVEEYEDTSIARETGVHERHRYIW
ncbi:hypothetical protein B0A54_00316 [Friedmanniomyces endolithicus]|uniref:Major facilitator superfamily (MFS) profile domain-containing protein n=1 Tax=Friedmanniomyces endolithicus TaxID=329885 RepID=A0A4U0VKA1_9PEZI|nr:hypothetical protein B0A54_00316 [Friedmanniomyces endolithicus]